jgi:hypothetical protein
MNSVFGMRLFRQRQSSKNIFEDVSSGTMSVRYIEVEVRFAKMSAFTYRDVIFRKNNSLFR